MKKGILLAAALAAAGADAFAAEDIRGADVTGFSYEAAYTGAEITFPGVKVVLDDERLKEGRDYAISYRNNVGPGEAALVVKGKGGYAGTVEIGFDITAPEEPKEAEQGVVAEAEGSGGGLVEEAPPGQELGGAGEDARQEAQDAGAEGLEGEATDEGAGDPAQEEPAPEREVAPLTGAPAPPYGSAAALLVLSGSAALAASAKGGAHGRKG